MSLPTIKSIMYSCAVCACGALSSVAFAASNTLPAPGNSAIMLSATPSQSDIAVTFTFSGSSNEVDKVCAILDYDRPTTTYVQLPLATSRRQVQCGTSLYNTNSVSFTGLTSNTKYWLSLSPYKFNGQNYTIPRSSSGVGGKEVTTAISATLLPTPVSSHTVKIISTETHLYDLSSKFVYEGPTSEFDKICSILDSDYTSGYYSVLPQASDRRKVQCITYQGNYGLLGFEGLKPGTKYWLSIFPYKKNGDRFVLPSNTSGIAAQEVMTSTSIEPFAVQATSITDSSVKLIVARPVQGEEQYKAECQSSADQSPLRGYSRTATVPVNFMRPNTSYKCVIYLYSTFNDSVQTISAGKSKEVVFTTLPQSTKVPPTSGAQSSVRSSAVGNSSSRQSSSLRSSARGSSQLPDLLVESIKVEVKMMPAKGGKLVPAKFVYAKIRNNNRADLPKQNLRLLTQWTPMGSARSYDDSGFVSFEKKEYLGGEDRTFATSERTDPWTLLRVDSKSGDVFKVTIDADNVVRESNERNNTFTYTVK